MFNLRDIKLRLKICKNNNLYSFNHHLAVTVKRRTSKQTLQWRPKYYRLIAPDRSANKSKTPVQSDPEAVAPETRCRQCSAVPGLHKLVVNPLGSGTNLQLSASLIGYCGSATKSKLLTFAPSVTERFGCPTTYRFVATVTVYVCAGRRLSKLK
jgi:hypothetical protein